MAYTLKNHLDTVLHTLDGNAPVAMQKAGEIAVEAIQKKMLYGYQTPHGRDHHTEIVDTGRLFDSITADVQHVSQNTWVTTAGASSEAGRMEDVSYAGYVHDGTAKLEGRPFIRDALFDQETQKAIEQEFVTELRNGFE